MIPALEDFWRAGLDRVTPEAMGMHVHGYPHGWTPALQRLVDLDPDVRREGAYIVRVEKNPTGPLDAGSGIGSSRGRHTGA